MTPNELEEFLQEQIPITNALGVRVVSASEARVELLCPLQPNHNHLGTAFGGSLAAIAVLAGYAWIFGALKGRGHDVHILLKTMQVDYEKPVEEAIRAVCEAPAKADFATFLNTFERKGLARLILISKIHVASGTACVLKGEFVAQKNKAAL